MMTSSWTVGWRFTRQRVHLLPGQGKGPQGHALVEPHPVADLGGLPDHHPGPVIDKEALADVGPGVDVDPRGAVGVFRHDAGNQGTFWSTSWWAMR